MITSNQEFIFKDRKGFTSPSGIYKVLAAFNFNQEEYLISARVTDSENVEISWFDVHEIEIENFSISNIENLIIGKLSEWNPTVEFQRV